MTEEILTEQELMVLSDAATRPTMRAWLEANNIPYLIARSGWPRVHRKAVERAMGVRNETTTSGSETTTSGSPVVFNFGALK